MCLFQESARIWKHGEPWCLCLHNTIPLLSVWVAMLWVHSHTLSLSWAWIPWKGQLLIVSFHQTPYSLCIAGRLHWSIFDLPYFHISLKTLLSPIIFLLTLPWFFVIGAFIWAGGVSDLWVPPWVCVCVCELSGGQVCSSFMNESGLVRTSVNHRNRWVFRP